MSTNFLDYSVQKVVNILGKHIIAISNNDFQAFQKLFTNKVKDQLNDDVFRKCIALFEKTPLDIEAIDVENSKFLDENTVDLKLIKSGRTLCKLIKVGNDWLADNIYWKIT
jgi:hypothetical protein